MLHYEEAVSRILADIPAPTPEPVPLSAADGRVLAQDVLSAIDLPPFDNSSMDGYAVRAADVATARPDAPVRLRLAGQVAAGAAFPGELAPGACVRLFTGSPLPRGADAVVMQEETRVEPADPAAVGILSPARPRENVRLQGEDAKRGAVLAGTGALLTAGRLSLLAAAGVAGVSVGRRPLVGLVATGSELKEPGETLAAAQIFESNRLGLAALVRRAGAIPKVFPLVPDALEPTRQALAGALDQCDAVVTSGGVSVGELDFVKAAFQQAGGKLQFWKVAIKPGRPFMFGRAAVAGRDRFLFGLPGNPVSALVTFVLLVRPALLRWQGASEVSLPGHPGVLAEALANPGERRHFMRVRVDAAGRVRSAGAQASHVLSSLAAADGLVDVPARSTLPAGSPVQVMRLL